MGTTSAPQPLSIGELMQRGDLIDAAMLEGTRRALVVHHKLGQNVVTWRDGKIALVPAAELLAEFDAVDAERSK
ncbi:MAG: hypothetical protein IT162_08045 [Bryobacterales bacterium]|nr:hypothetical protein [Bryobacterales bacterium]